MALLAGCGSNGSSDTATQAANASTDSGKYSGQTLHFYNPGEYIGEDVISNFEKKFGCRVLMDNFDSNESMYIKVANGDKYDVIVPSDYMIERLMQEDLLQPLDLSKITCFDKLDKTVLANMEFDAEHKYAVPYFWGSVGIVYDTTKVDEADLEAEGYGIFKNQKYKGDIYLYDSERDSLMMALKYLGYSMNTNDEAELNEAYEFLLEVVNTMEPEIVTDEIIDNMAQGRKALGLLYSGDAAYVLSENENMGFYMPETGTNLWIDAMVIPKNAQNVELAHEWINYISSYEAALDNSVTVGYTSPNVEVFEELSGEGGEYEGISAYVPSRENENDEVFHYDEKARKIIAELWSKIKIAASNV
ncbi:MAG: ABC transporter substrate-binding protein [Eubacteriales bacterium]|nr:ABC transporter substrate-binding protein [Eubacteriales bacterium]